MLSCGDCKAEHDFDASEEGAADTGECRACGGPLVESEEERQKVEAGLGFHSVVDRVSDGLAAAAIARRRAGKGLQ